MNNQNNFSQMMTALVPIFATCFIVASCANGMVTGLANAVKPSVSGDSVVITSTTVEILSRNSILSDNQDTVGMLVAGCVMVLLAVMFLSAKKSNE